VGQNVYPVQADLTSGPSVKIRVSRRRYHLADNRGRLSGALQTVNQLLPSYRDGLNQLAQGIADAVNATLTAGSTPMAIRAPLFSYQPPNIAKTLAATSITAGQLAAATPGGPGGNGNTLALANLETSPAINGLTFSGFYGNLAAGVGRNVADARDSQSVQQQLLAQARPANSPEFHRREAVRLVEYQRLSGRRQAGNRSRPIDRGHLDMIRWRRYDQHHQFIGG
jgi:flagellar hook-associated protein FlgK